MPRKSGADEQKQSLQAAATQQQKLADALKQLAEHYEKLESGQPEETRLALRAQEEQLGIKEQLDAQYARADQMANLAQESPEGMLAQLEKALPVNQLMQQELSGISKETLAASEKKAGQASQQESAWRRRSQIWLRKRRLCKTRIRLRNKRSSPRKKRQKLPQSGADATVSEKLGEQMGNGALDQQADRAADLAAEAAQAAQQAANAAQQMTTQQPQQAMQSAQEARRKQARPRRRRGNRPPKQRRRRKWRRRMLPKAVTRRRTTTTLPRRQGKRCSLPSRPRKQPPRHRKLRSKASKPHRPCSRRASRRRRQTRSPPPASRRIRSLHKPQINRRHRGSSDRGWKRARARRAARNAAAESADG
jgi:hypothetical protein